MNTDSKIEKLSLIYPSIEKSTLLELLLACNGSQKGTENLINESLPPSQQPKRRKAEGPLYQSSLSSIILSDNDQQNSVKRRHLNSDYATTKTMKRTSSRALLLYQPEDVKRHLHPYVSLHRPFLSPDLSNRLLQHLCKNIKPQLKANEFYLFGQLCKSEHELGMFSRSNDPEAENLIYNGKNVSTKTYTDILEEVSKVAEDFINEKIIPQQNQVLPFQQVDSKREWKAEKCVINYYKNSANHLDWHSDRLNHMGPHNYIVSISVGATREFRVRRNYDNIEDSKNPSPIYSIVVPHNSVLIMHPGCQEEYKHCVNTMSGPLEVHNISGTGRFNLTFRYFPLYYTKNVPKCKCNMNMSLRRAYKDVRTRGKYFWTCEGKYQEKDCGAFHWADFTNISGNYISENEADSSEWIADDDYTKQNYGIEDKHT